MFDFKNQKTLHFFFQAEESIQDEIGATRVIKRRLAHLQERESIIGIIEGGSPTPWQKNRLDRMLVEYFLRAGYYNTALKLARHSNIEVQIYFVSHR